MAVATRKGRTRKAHALMDGAHAPEMKQKAYELFAQGFGYRTCARQLGISIYTARDWNRHYNNGTFEPETGYRRRRRYFTDDFKREIARAYLKENVSINQIAQKYTVTRRSVTQWVEKFKDELMKEFS